MSVAYPAGRLRRVAREHGWTCAVRNERLWGRRDVLYFGRRTRRDAPDNVTITVQLTRTGKGIRLAYLDRPRGSDGNPPRELTSTVTQIEAWLRTCGDKEEKENERNGGP